MDSFFGRLAHRSARGNDANHRSGRQARPAVEMMETRALLSTLDLQPNQIDCDIQYSSNPSSITSLNGPGFIAAYAGSGYVEKGFFDFTSDQFSAIPAGATITSAVLTFDKVYGQQGANDPFHYSTITLDGLPGHSQEFTNEPSGPWSAFGSGDFTGGQSIGSFQTDPADSDSKEMGVYPVDVTSFVNSMLESDPNFHLIGFRLDPSPGGDFGMEGGVTGNGFDCIHLTITYRDPSATATTVTANLPQQGGSYTFTPGTPYTLTATVQPQDPGGGTPAGTVDFTVDGAVTKVPLADGVATLPVTPAGADEKVDAEYEGSDDDQASDATEIDLDAEQPASTTTTVTANLPQEDGTYTFTPGTPYTLTATVAPQDPGGGTPAGTVDFTVDGAVTKVPLANGVATLSVTPAQGDDEVKVGAHYEGSDDDQASDATEIGLDAAPTYPTITPTALSWLPDGSGVSVDYTVSGDLSDSDPAEVDLDWSPTPFYSPDQATPARDATGKAAVIPVEPSHASPTLFTQSQLGTPPSGTHYLLAVADPTHAATAPNAPAEVASVAYNPSTNIIVQYANWTAPDDQVTVLYSIAGAALPDDLSPQLTLSWAQGQSYASRIQTSVIGTPEPELSVPLEKSPGSHVATFSLADMGEVPPNATNLLVVADPPQSVAPNGVITETTKDDNSLAMTVQRSDLAWGNAVSAEFRQKLTQVAADLKIDPNSLMAAMAFETGGSFNPAQPNIQKVVRSPQGKVTKVVYGSARGLIQFMPKTAESLGTSSEELVKMSAVQQLDYVEDYFEPAAGRLNSIDDVYMQIFDPSGVGKSGNFVLFRRPQAGYRQNRGLDSDGLGYITKDMAASKVKATLQKGLQAPNVYQTIQILPAGTPPSAQKPSSSGTTNGS